MCVGNDTLAWDRGKTLPSCFPDQDGYCESSHFLLSHQKSLLRCSCCIPQRMKHKEPQLQSQVLKVEGISVKKKEKKRRSCWMMHTWLLQSMAHVPRKRRIWCVVPRDSSAKCFLNFRMLPTSLHINQANKKINSRMGGEDIWKTGESELTDNNGKDSKWLKRSSSLYIPFLQSLFFFYLKGGFSFRCLSK